MADTNSLHTTPSVESDGIRYSGIIWFIVILVGTVVFCQVLVWGMLRLMQRYDTATETPRAPLAAPAATPDILDGHLSPGNGVITKPGLLVNEPEVLHAFRAQEDQDLDTYGWIDQAAGTVRLPIDRAKALLLERGLPARSQAPAAPPAATPGGR